MPRYLPDNLFNDRNMGVMGNRATDEQEGNSENGNQDEIERNQNEAAASQQNKDTIESKNE